MTVKVEYPYSELYTGANVYVGPDGRRRIYLYGKGIKTTTAYARYLLAVKLGRFLTKDETVDHIDNDKTNDSIDNLQILSLRANVQKAPHPIKSGHGTVRCYRRGCRCEQCITANRTYQKQYRDTHPDKIKQFKAKAGDVDHICDWCGENFKAHSWEKNRRFCSVSCASKYKARKQKETKKI